MHRVLIVEDDPQVRAMLVATLTGEGYEVTQAENGSEALSAYEAAPADLVITDIIMPGTDGVEAIHRLKNAHPDVKIVAISGGSTNLAGEHLLKTAERLGALKTFNKPVDMLALLTTVAELTGGESQP